MALTLLRPSGSLAMQICQSIGLCSAVAAQEEQLQQQQGPRAFKQGRKDRMFMRRPEAASSEQQQTSPASEVLLPGWDRLAQASEAGGADNGDSVVCDFCTTAVQYIKIALESNQTIADVSRTGVRLSRPARLTFVCLCVWIRCLVLCVDWG
jgi:hypothetical protein